MDWDYRIIKQVDGLMKIHQVFYKEDGSVYGMSEDEIAIEGFELDELKVELEAIAQAFSKPVIEMSPKKSTQPNIKLVKKEPEEEIPRLDFKEFQFKTIFFN